MRGSLCSHPSRDSTAAVSTQMAPAAPIHATDSDVMTIEPSTAPSENPRYMKEALSESATGALATPTTNQAILLRREETPRAQSPQNNQRHHRGQRVQRVCERREGKPGKCHGHQRQRHLLGTPRVAD